MAHLFKIQRTTFGIAELMPHPRKILIIENLESEPRKLPRKCLSMHGEIARFEILVE